MVRQTVIDIGDRTELKARVEELKKRLNEQLDYKSFLNEIDRYLDGRVEKNWRTLERIHILVREKDAQIAEYEALKEVIEGLKSDPKDKIE